MNKFTTFLDDEKKAPTAIDARKLFAPQVYHNKREIKIYRLALVITILILIIAIIVNIICYPFLLANKQVNTTIEEAALHDGSSEEVRHTGNPSLAYQNPDKEPLYETIPICSTTSTFKSWMDYRKITSTSSSQWKLQKKAYTDETGFRKIDDYYMVAMAKQYGPIGTKYLITFSGGSMIYVIIGDIKGGTDCIHPDKSMIEFIVNKNTLISSVKSSGNVNKLFEGTIIEIRVIK